MNIKKLLKRRWSEMDSKILSSKLIELEKKHKRLEMKHSEVEDQIDDLENEKEDLEDELDSLESSIEEIKKQLLENKVSELSKFTGDKFTDDFIRASHFCSVHDEYRHSLEYVEVSDTELTALDGYRAIVIKNNAIPNEIKNSMIKWDVRKDFKDNKSKENLPTIDIKKLLDEQKKDYKIIINDVKAVEFYNKFNIQEVNSNDKNGGRVEITVEDLTLWMNKQFLETTLMVLGEEKFRVSFGTPITPVKFETASITIIVLPIRILNGMKK
jgi:hypothetical protein